ncbi:MAG: IS110 family transposase [Egibacteraceae bacterium]
MTVVDREVNRMDADVVVARCAGLDVHTDSVAACVRVPGPSGGRLEEVRTFGTTTVRLLGLADWLESKGVTHVAMQATGIYWKPVYYLLEERLTCWLVNARHVHALPGRKPTSPTVCGSAGCWQQGCCPHPASCRPNRSASCGTCAAGRVDRRAA